MTEIKYVIEKGESIPDDVTGVQDDDGDRWKLDPEGWYLLIDPAKYSGKTSAWLLSTFGPLTVTAVREPDPPAMVAQTAQGEIVIPGALAPAAAVPPPSVLLDLVRQYGSLCVASGMHPRSSADEQARTLLGRIDDLLPQQPVQARDNHGDLLWIHGCGHVAAVDATPGDDVRGLVQHRDCTTGVDGPWRPLLVGGGEVPQQDRREPHTDGPREPTWQELGDHFLMQALGVERLEDVMPAIELLKARVDHLRNWRIEHDKRERERDEARAELEHHLDSVDRLAGERNEARAEVERLKAANELLEAQRLDAWAHVHALDAARAFSPATSNPLVLSLPTVPDGAVAVSAADLALVLAQQHGHSHLRPGVWDDDNAPDRAGKPCRECAARARLEGALPPPREPRTWPKLDGPPKDLMRFKDASGKIWRRGDGDIALWCWADNSGTLHGFRTFAEIQHEGGPLTEVFDDEPGGGS